MTGVASTCIKESSIYQKFGFLKFPVPTLQHTHLKTFIQTVLPCGQYAVKVQPEEMKENLLQQRCLFSFNG
jgi:hypothetical protein